MPFKICIWSLHAVVAALRRAERELPDREMDSASITPDVFADVHIDSTGGDRYLVATVCMADEDPMYEALKEGPARVFLSNNSHAALFRYARGRVELPMTMAEWFTSDKSWPSVLNRTRATFETCANRGNVDQMLLLISAMFSGLGPDFAAKQLRNLSLARLTTAAESEFTFNPPSLAIGQALRAASNRHMGTVVAEQVDSGKSGSSDEEKKTAMRTLLGTTSLAELWSRHSTSNLFLFVTGTLCKDLLPNQAVSIYAEENEYNDEPDEEEARIIPAFFAACAVLEELSSVTFASPLMRTEIKLTGFDFTSAMPHSFAEAVAVARQFHVSYHMKPEDDSGSDSEDIPDQIDFEDDDAWEDSNGGRKPSVVKFEKDHYRAVGRNRFNTDGPAIVTRFAPRSAVRVAVCMPVPTVSPTVAVYRHLRMVGVPLNNAMRLERFFPRMVDDELQSAFFRAVIDGVRIEVVVGTSCAVLAQAHAVIAGADSELGDEAPVISGFVVATPEITEEALKSFGEARVVRADSAKTAMRTVLDNLPADVLSAARGKAPHPLDF